MYQRIISVKTGIPAKALKDVEEHMRLNLAYFLAFEYCAYCKEKGCRGDLVPVKIKAIDEHYQEVTEVLWFCSPNHTAQYLLSYHPRFLEWKNSKNYLPDWRGL